MNKKLLTLEDLYGFYSQKKKSMSFSAEKSGYNIAVQTHAVFELEDDLTEGLLYGKIRAFHDLSNRNNSHIETDVLEEKMMSIKDRPIMADIIEISEEDENGNPIKDFSGHTMYYDENLDKMIYKEIPVGHFVHPESIHLEYDEEFDRNFVCSDVVVYEEYTDTCEILRRRKTVDCSIELVIRTMHWDNTDKTLHLDDFYVQGCTLLGKGVLPGMAGSKLTLKDFSEENNSLFSSISEDEHSKLIETLDNLNKTLSSININSKTILNTTEKFEKGGNEKVNMTKFEELLKKYNKTVDDITFEYEGMPDTELEELFTTLFGEEGEGEEPVEPKPNDEPESVEEPVTTTEEPIADNPEPDTVVTEEKYSKTFELSHEDIRTALYALLAPIEESLNEYYWIVKTTDDYFIYQVGCNNIFYKQAYTKENDEVRFEGERQDVFAEFVTAEEKATLDNMRANYSSISEKLAQYEEAEQIADKMTVFEDEAYKNYLETDEFKSLMDVENVKKFTKEELTEKADAALGKVVKTTKTFTMNIEEPKKDEKRPAFLAFARTEQNSSFLDGLLNNKNKETK